MQILEFPHDNSAEEMLNEMAERVKTEKPRHLVVVAIFDEELDGRTVSAIELGTTSDVIGTLGALSMAQGRLQMPEQYERVDK